MLHVVLLADTHVRDDGRPCLPAGVMEALSQADAVLHAGDVVSAGLLERLRSFAPVHAVLGNNDHGLDLPAAVEVVLGGVRVAMVHDSGAAAGRAARMRRRFPAADLVVFGHSHVPLIERDGNRLLVNPGSPTQRRRQPITTFATLSLDGGTVRAVTVRAAADGEPVTLPLGPASP